MNKGVDIAYRILGAVLSMVFLSHCNPVSNNDPHTSGQVRLTGIIVNQVVTLSTMNSRAVGDAITHISAIPLLSPTIDSHLLELEEEFQLSEDGIFDISLSTESPWLLVLKNKNSAIRRDLYCGVIAIADQQESLIYFPLDQVNSDIDLSEILGSEDEYISNMGIEMFCTFFDCPLQDIQLLARFDNIGKYIKNYYANYNPATTALYDMGVTYGYLSRDQIVDGVYLTPQQYQKERYGLWCWTQDVTDFDIDSLLSGSTTLFLRPPVGAEIHATFSDDIYTCENPLSTAGEHWESNYFNSIDYYFDGGLSVRVSTSSGDPESFCAWLTGETTEGTWILERDGEEIAWFDLTSACETDAEGNFTIFVPVPMFEFDDQGILSAVEVMFVYYDRETLSYVELPDYGILSSFISLFACALADYDQSAGPNGFYEERLVWDDSHLPSQGRIRITEFEYSWRAQDDGEGTALIIDEFGVGFVYGAVHFGFGLRTDGGK